MKNQTKQPLFPNNLVKMASDKTEGDWTLGYSDETARDHDGAPQIDVCECWDDDLCNRVQTACNAYDDLVAYAELEQAYATSQEALVAACKKHGVNPLATCTTYGDFLAAFRKQALAKAKAGAQ